MLETREAIPDSHSAIEAVSSRCDCKQAHEQRRRWLRSPHQFRADRSRHETVVIAVPSVQSENARVSSSRTCLTQIRSYLTNCFRALRRAALEHGAHCLAPAPGLDCNCLRQAEDRLSLFQHSRLEHFPVPDAHREEQGRPDPLRRGHPAGARGAFPGDDRRSLRSRRHARRPARGARAQRRGAGAHLYRPPLQERHRAAGKAVRALHQNDRAAHGASQEDERREASA